MTDDPVRPDQPDDDGREPEEEEEGLQAGGGARGAPAVEGGGRAGLHFVGVGGGVGAAVEGGRVDQHLHGLWKEERICQAKFDFLSCIKIANLLILGLSRRLGEYGHGCNFGVG